MVASLTGTEGCTAILPQVNPKEWDNDVRVVFYLMLLLHPYPGAHNAEEKS